MVAAEWMPPQQQVHPLLMLPDMRHFVDEQTLIGQIGATEISAIQITPWMKVDHAARRHDRFSRLKEGPFAIGDPDAAIVDRRSEHAFGQLGFSRRQKTDRQCA